MLYNRTEHSQGFSICFIIKNPLNYPSITFNFQNKLYFPKRTSLWWQRRKTRLQRLMWIATQRIGKDIRASSYFFTRRAADVVSEACFTVMTGDRHDERAAMNFSMIIFAQTPSWLVWILTIMPVWLYFLSFLFCFWTLNFIYYTSVSCVWFLLPYVSLQSNWAWKSLKLGMSILFFLWGFSYLLTF